MIREAQAARKSVENKHLKAGYSGGIASEWLLLKQYFIYSAIAECATNSVYPQF